MPLQSDRPIFNRHTLTKKKSLDPHDAVLFRYVAAHTPVCFRFNSGRELQGIIREVHRFYVVVQVSDESKIVVWKTHLETTAPASGAKIGATR